MNVDLVSELGIQRNRHPDVLHPEMLPPTNSSTLDRNPRFKALYQDLVNSRLNADGSSRLIKQQRAQADIEKVSEQLYNNNVSNI